MYTIRCSTCEDIPALRELWALAFGDGGAYLDNFFAVAYRPEQMLVLETEGAVRAMTYWFDTGVVLSDGEERRCAYLYAVATHPDFRGRGLAGDLLAWIDGHLAGLGISLVSTVPATPSLHRFFGANGFSEAFSHDLVSCGGEGGEAAFPLRGVTAEEYGRLREELLGGTVHVTYDRAALEYQAGCCRLSGGGLYALHTPEGTAVLCAEGLEGGGLLIKELLGAPPAQAAVLACLPGPLDRPVEECRIPGEKVPFGMLKELNRNPERTPIFPINGYLGLAFD